MQLELFPEVDAITVSLTPDSLSRALTAVRAARSSDTHATAVERVVRIVTPRIQRIVACYAPAWPDRAVTVDDLTQEVLLEVIAAIHFAPRGSEARVNAWVSTLAFAVLHARWHAAKAMLSSTRTAQLGFVEDVGTLAGIAGGMLDADPEPMGDTGDDTDAGDPARIAPSASPANAAAA